MRRIIYNFVIKYIYFLLCCYQQMFIQNGTLQHFPLLMTSLLSSYKLSVCTQCGVPFIVSPRTAGLSLRNATQVVLRAVCCGIGQSAGEVLGL